MSRGISKKSISLMTCSKTIIIKSLQVKKCGSKKLAGVIYERKLVKMGFCIFVNMFCSCIKTDDRLSYNVIEQGLLHIFFGLSCFFHKPEKFWDKIRANTFLGENIGPDVRVLVPDVKVLVQDVKVLVPGCGSTGPWMWKYWSLDVSNCVRKCCRKSLRLIV